MDSEKDRWGEKLRESEKAREDKYFAERDRELVAKLRSSQAQAGGTCPECGEPLEAREQPPLRVLACHKGHGVWISKEQAPALLDPAAAVALAGLFSTPETR